MDGAWASGVTPDGANVEKQIGTNNVRITFMSDAHGSVRAILNQERLLWLVGALHEKIERSPLTPISVERLRPGASIAVHGVSVKSDPNGFRIVLTAEFEDRVVQIPFSLTTAEARDLGAELMR